jgi:hypothetical protein
VAGVGVRVGFTAFGALVVAGADGFAGLLLTTGHGADVPDADFDTLAPASTTLSAPAGAASVNCMTPTPAANPPPTKTVAASARTGTRTVDMRAPSKVLCWHSVLDAP